MLKIHAILILVILPSLCAGFIPPDAGAMAAMAAPDAVQTNPNNVPNGAGTTDTFRQPLSLKA